MRIALTGGIAEGKSTVLEMARTIGVRVGSADAVVAALWESVAMRERIGQVLGLEGPVDRSSVREAIASDPARRRALNALFHRRVLEELLDSHAQLIEVTLLLETCSQGWFDRVWVVSAGREEQLRRLAERSGGDAAVEALLRTQLSSPVRIAFADRVFRTNCPMQDVQREVAVAIRAAWGLGS